MNGPQSFGYNPPVMGGYQGSDRTFLFSLPDQEGIFLRSAVVFRGNDPHLHAVSLAWNGRDRHPLGADI